MSRSDFEAAAPNLTAPPPEEQGGEIATADVEVEAVGEKGCDSAGDSSLLRDYVRTHSNRVVSGLCFRSVTARRVKVPDTASVPEYIRLHGAISRAYGSLPKLSGNTSFPLTLSPQLSTVEHDLCTR